MTNSSDMPSDTNKQDNKNKHLLSYQTTLRYSYLVWVLFRLCVMPWIWSVQANKSSYDDSFVWQVLMIWQVLVLLPALLFLPVIWHANHPYRLIVLSFVMTVYAGVATSRWLIAWYEQGGLLVWLYGVESSLLLTVLGLLFMTLKKLPPMHKMNGNQNR